MTTLVVPTAQPLALALNQLASIKPGAIHSSANSHSFASMLVNSERSLYEVQHILGHAQVKSTQRYAHLSQETLLDAANSPSTALGAAMLPMA